MENFFVGGNILVENLDYWRVWLNVRFERLEDLFLMYLEWLGCLLSLDWITWIEYNTLYIYL